MDRPYSGGARHHSLGVDADVDPTQFSFNSPQTNGYLRRLWHRNEHIQLLIDWMVFEAFRRGVQFIEDEGAIEGIKHNQPYSFKGYTTTDKNSGKTIEKTGFEEYIEWNDVWTEWKLGVSYSRLYPEGALLVFLDDTDSLFPQKDKAGQKVIHWKANKNPQGYFKLKAYHPLTVGVGTGFSVQDADGDGNVTVWKLQIMTENMKRAKTFYIDAERCIHMIWTKKENSFYGSSRVMGLSRVAQLEMQMFEKLSKRAHDLAGGILTLKGIESASEQAEIEDAIGDSLSSVDVLFMKGEREVEWVTPDLKAAGEFSSIFEMFTRKICRHMRISQLVLDGEHTGASLGGTSNPEIFTSYSEIYQIQEHYRNYLESVFYKLGKTNTTFIYNEILPEDITAEDQGIGEDGSGGEGEEEEGGEDGDVKGDKDKEKPAEKSD